MQDKFILKSLLKHWFGKKRKLKKAFKRLTGWKAVTKLKHIFLLITRFVPTHTCDNKIELLVQSDYII